MKERCPSASWIVSGDEAVPFCMGSFEDWDDYQRVMGYVAKQHVSQHCIDLVGGVNVGEVYGGIRVIQSSSD